MKMGDEAVIGGVSRRGMLLAAALAGLGAAPKTAAQEDGGVGEAVTWVAIRTYELKPEADRASLVAKTQAEFVPILAAQPGFVAFYVLAPAPTTWMAVSVWDTAEAAAASNETARAWVAANVLDSVASGPETIEAAVDIAAIGADAATPATTSG